MKKNLLFAGLLMIGSISSYALEIQPFLGVEVNKADIDIKLSGSITINGDTSSAGISYSVEETDVGFRLGAYLDDNQRAYVNYVKYEDEGEYLENIALNYDYIFSLPNNITNTFNIMPYIGAHVGQGKLNVLDVFNGTGIIYGGQAGLIIPGTKAIELEIGYKYTFIDVDDSVSAEVTSGGTTLNANAKIEVDDMSTFFASVNWKF